MRYSTKLYHALQNCKNTVQYNTALRLLVLLYSLLSLSCCKTEGALIISRHAPIKVPGQLSRAKKATCNIF